MKKHPKPRADLLSAHENCSTQTLLQLSKVFHLIFIYVDEFIWIVSDYHDE